jgi:multidrug efflux system outer membrane protein
MLILSGLAIVGCASPAPRGALPLQDAPGFSADGDAALADQWWRALGDASLDQRIDKALSANFDLVAAWERINVARSLVRRERSDLWPDIDATVDVDHDDGSVMDDQTEFAVGLQAAYEVDLWGRIRSRVDAQRLRASATEQDYHAAAISLSAEVALAWYALAQAHLEINLIRSQIQTNQKVLDLIRARFRAGQVRRADVLRQEQLVEATREQLTIAQARAAVGNHRLAILEGRPPQSTINVAPTALVDLPPTPRTGLPAELVQRRPDVRSALLELEAADKDVASAVSDQYPRLNLTASLRTAAERPERLFREWLASLAGQIVAPLLDAGQRRAEIERTVAVRRQRLAEYGQVVLEAFGEVEDALALERLQTRRLGSVTRQLDYARQTYRQLRLQYLNGAAEYIDVLTSIRDQQQLERELLFARLALIEHRIALHRALAGGFQTPHQTDGPRQEDQEAPRGG